MRLPVALNSHAERNDMCMCALLKPVKSTTLFVLMVSYSHLDAHVGDSRSFRMATWNLYYSTKVVLYNCKPPCMM